MNLAPRIDHTLLNAHATRPQIRNLISQALQYGFASVCVNGYFVADVAKTLHGSVVKTCGVVDFPLGANKAIVKAMQATSIVKDGAQEIDFVAHLPNLIKKDVAAAKAEYLEIVKAARAVSPQVIIKVIVESAYLMADVDDIEAEARIEAACRAVRESGCDFIKTSTGFHRAGGATVQAVSLMKKHSGGLYVKASGGIRNYDDAMKMIDAGADRLGCSAGVEIVQSSSTISESN
jgi:deoxyribose-phosphate aldolase